MVVVMVRVTTRLNVESCFLMQISIDQESCLGWTVYNINILIYLETLQLQQQQQCQNLNPNRFRSTT